MNEGYNETKGRVKSFLVTNEINAICRAISKQVYIFVFITYITCQIVFGMELEYVIVKIC